MNRCIIFGSAEINNYNNIKIHKNDYIIAADGGLFHVSKIGAFADLLLGDFDSIREITDNYKEKLTVPAEKDDTDMMLAVKTAISKGYKEIVMYGALGGRLDHTFANIQTLEYIYEQGCNGTIVGDSDVLFFQGQGIRHYNQIDGYYFSVFAISPETVITTSGTKYNLDKDTLNTSFPLGVSNEISEKSCSVEVISGKLLIIFSSK